MKKILLWLLLLNFSVAYAQSTKQEFMYHGPKTVGFWLYPFLNQNQADGLIGYDILVIHNEIIYAQSPMIDYLFQRNPKLQLIVYFNQSEWFVPPYENCPWAIQMVTDLNQGNRKLWWLRQPNDKPVVFWTGFDGRQTCIMDMRINSVKVNNESYCEFAARRFNADILSKDPRIIGMETDNAWPSPMWLGRFGQNKGLDFNRDKKVDQNDENLSAAWKAGQLRFIQNIRQKKGNKFIIIANPGTLDFASSVDGINLEDFPFEYAGNMMNGGWNISMHNAANGGPSSILQARKGNWFFTLCSAMLQDNVCFADIQNAPYRPEYKIPLGKPLEKPCSNFMRNQTVFTRTYEGGTVFVNPKLKEAWIEDLSGQVIYDKKGLLVSK